MWLDILILVFICSSLIQNIVKMHLESKREPYKDLFEECSQLKEQLEKENIIWNLKQIISPDRTLTNAGLCYELRDLYMSHIVDDSKVYWISKIVQEYSPVEYKFDFGIYLKNLDVLILYSLQDEIEELNKYELYQTLTKERKETKNFL